MGCGASSVPKVIIPDPEGGKRHKVLFKKQGMFASDQNVYQDCDTSKKWLFMDREGKFFDPETKFWLENFVRPEGSKKGQVLCSAILNLTQLKKYGHEVHEDSDSSEADTDDSDVEVNVVKHKMKWAQTIKVNFFQTRDFSDKLATVKVKAKGKAKKKTITIEKEVDDHDAEGNKIGCHTEKEVRIDIEKKVKKVKYTITEMKGEDEMPPIVLKGKPNGKDYKLEWSGPVFESEIGSNGWGTQQIEVTTEWKHSGLGMLMGYIIAKEISPDDIKDNVTIF